MAARRICGRKGTLQEQSNMCFMVKEMNCRALMIEQLREPSLTVGLLARVAEPSLTVGLLPRSYCPRSGCLEDTVSSVSELQRRCGGGAGAERLADKVVEFFRMLLFGHHAAIVENLQVGARV